MRIRDQVILITGASEGIGAACARLLRARGAKLSLVARNRQLLEAGAGPQDLVVPADLCREADRESAIARTLDHFGRIDILINNAGVGLYMPTWQAPMVEARAMFELNFFAPLHLAQLAARDMMGRREGLIVNVGSIAGRVTLPWLTLYSATKFALGSFTDGLRMELKRYGIRTMTVCPGYVRTNFQQHILGGQPPAALANNKQFTITADQCAAAIARGIEKDSRTVMTPRIGWLFVALARLFPSTVDSVLEGIYNRNLAA